MNETKSVKDKIDVLFDSYLNNRVKEKIQPVIENKEKHEKERDKPVSIAEGETEREQESTVEDSIADETEKEPDRSDELPPGLKHVDEELIKTIENFYREKFMKAPDEEEEEEEKEEEEKEEEKPKPEVRLVEEHTPISRHNNTVEFKHDDFIRFQSQEKFQAFLSFMKTFNQREINTIETTNKNKEEFEYSQSPKRQKTEHSNLVFY